MPCLRRVTCSSPCLQVDLVPAQAHQLGHAQAVAVGNQDQRGIARTMATDACRRRHQRRHLPVRRVFPAAVRDVRPAQGNFPVFDGWRNFRGFGLTTPYWTKDSMIAYRTINARVKICRIPESWRSKSIFNT
jgi:hypothetical protein